VGCFLRELDLVGYEGVVLRAGVHSGADSVVAGQPGFDKTDDEKWRL